MLNKSSQDLVISILLLYLNVIYYRFTLKLKITKHRYIYIDLILHDLLYALNLILPHMEIFNPSLLDIF